MGSAAGELPGSSGEKKLSQCAALPPRPIRVGDGAGLRKQQLIMGRGANDHPGAAASPRNGLHFNGVTTMEEVSLPVVRPATHDECAFRCACYISSLRWTGEANRLVGRA